MSDDMMTEFETRMIRRIELLERSAKGNGISAFQQLGDFKRTTAAIRYDFDSLVAGKKTNPADRCG